MGREVGRVREVLSIADVISAFHSTSNSRHTGRHRLQPLKTASRRPNGWKFIGRSTTTQILHVVRNHDGGAFRVATAELSSDPDRCHYYE